MAKVAIYEPLVSKFLYEDPRARADDVYLWYRVCQELAPEILNKPFGTVLLCHKEMHLPNKESVGRCRRKLQEKNPNLKILEIADKREEREAEYKEYARS